MYALKLSIETKISALFIIIGNSISPRSFLPSFDVVLHFTFHFRPQRNVISNQPLLPGKHPEQLLSREQGFKRHAQFPGQQQQQFQQPQFQQQQQQQANPNALPIQNEKYNI